MHVTELHVTSGSSLCIMYKKTLCDMILERHVVEILKRCVYWTSIDDIVILFEASILIEHSCDISTIIA